MYIDRIFLVFVIGIYIVSPAIVEWSLQGVWYRPYLIWVMLIVLAFWVAKSRDIDGL